ncbi:hypothetical protein JCM10296v2_002430 [Rhodotorula toruloides]
MARTAAQRFSRPLSTRRTSGQSTDEQGASPAPSSTEQKARRVVVSGTTVTAVAKEGTGVIDSSAAANVSRMRGRVCTYSAAGPSNAQIGSRPFQQNQEEIARLKKQVDILARVLRLTKDELETLSLEAGGPLNPQPPARNSPPPDLRPKDRFDAMFSPGDPLIDLCRATAVDSDVPMEASQTAAPPANLNIRDPYDDIPITRSREASVSVQP